MAQELLRQRLIECGWRDDMKAYCKQLIKERGLENINIDELVEVTRFEKNKFGYPAPDAAAGGRSPKNRDFRPSMK